MEPRFRGRVKVYHDLKVWEKAGEKAGQGFSGRRQTKGMSGWKASPTLRNLNFASDSGEEKLKLEVGMGDMIRSVF